MRPIRVGASIVLGVALAGPASGGSAAAPVLVELFTSQGCSSCPPADAYLRELAADGVDGVPVIPLAFHVDYWNRLGWSDPFSSAEASRRQQDYGRALGRDGVYTPQLVVAGSADCVGSDRACIRAAVRAAAGRAARGTLELRVRLDGARMLVDVTAPLLSAVDGTLPAAAGSQRLVIALRESGLVTEVPRGENASRRLENDFVVRRLTTIEDAAGSSRTTFELDPGWRRERLDVAAFIQEPGGLAVRAAASAGAAAPPGTHAVLPRAEAAR